MVFLNVIRAAAAALAVPALAVPALALAIATGAAAQSTSPTSPATPPMPQMQQTPGMPGMAMPQIPQKELDEELVRRAVDAMGAMREEFGDVMPSMKNGSPPPDMAIMQQMALAAQPILKAHGFPDPQEWYASVINIVIARQFLLERSPAEFDAEIAKMETDPNIPENIRGQVIAMMKQLRPSDNNLAVMRTVMADEEYSEKLKRVIDE